MAKSIFMTKKKRPAGTQTNERHSQLRSNLNHSHHYHRLILWVKVAFVQMKFIFT